MIDLSLQGLGIDVVIPIRIEKACRGFEVILEGNTILSQVMEQSNQFTGSPKPNL